MSNKIEISCRIVFGALLYLAVLNIYQCVQG